MKLDLLKPVIVIPGRWNAAILSPEWLAPHFFNLDQDSIDGNIIEVYESGALTKNILFIDGIGIAASDARVEIFASAEDADHFGMVQSAAHRLLSALAHTPIGACGYNFSFSDLGDNEAFQDLLEVEDPLKGELVRTNSKVSSTYEYSNDVELNVQKDQRRQSLSLNFHRRIAPNEEAAEALAAFPLIDAFAFAKEVTAKYFGIESYRVSAFDVPNHRGVNDDKGEAQSAQAVESR